MISKYQIFGERNSGTNYLDRVLKDNVYLIPTEEYGYKHWFIKNHHPRGRDNTTTDNECIKSINSDTDDTLFIFIVREPYGWLNSMYHKPWHAYDHQNISFSDFIRKEWLSYEFDVPSNHDAESLTPWIPEVDGKCFIEEANNICHLRNMKNIHFMNLVDKVKTFHLIRQDRLEEDLNELVENFNVKLKNQKLTLNEYRKPKIADPIDDEDRDFINCNLDFEMELRLGFALE